MFCVVKCVKLTQKYYSDRTEKLFINEHFAFILFCVIVSRLSPMQQGADGERPGYLSVSVVPEGLQEPLPHELGEHAFPMRLVPQDSFKKDS